MKYNTVLFDWGDTLCCPDVDSHWKIYPWAVDMIRGLYHSSYRLGIISNTSRYQDAQWVRRKLSEAGILQLFEVLIFSANFDIEKPDIEIFFLLHERLIFIL